MTPSLLYALLAVFAACTGYAAGRLHQWHRMDADREEAYREGYDAAARSTFTMAARVAGRREKPSARASATVFRAAPAEAPPMLPPPATLPPSPATQSASPAAPLASPAAPLASPATHQAGLAASSASSAAAESISGAAPAAGSPAGPGSAAGPVGGRSAFPAPVSAPFPAPAKPVLFPPVTTPAPQSSDASPDAAGADAEPSAPRRRGRITGRLPRRGRHLVPPELVRAATYRLNPDRVARARVPGALPPPGDKAADPAEQAGQGAAGPEHVEAQPASIEAEPTVRPPTVPKPRSS